MAVSGNCIELELSCLVVEDEPGIAWAIRRLLEQARSTGSVAESGASGWEQLGRGTSTAIFLDVKLPDADGFELAGTIRGIASATPIVMISAYFYPHDPKGSTDAGGKESRAASSPSPSAMTSRCSPRYANWWFQYDATGNALHSPKSSAYGAGARDISRRRYD